MSSDSEKGRIWWSEETCFNASHVADLKNAYNELETLHGFLVEESREEEANKLDDAMVIVKHFLDMMRLEFIQTLIKENEGMIQLVEKPESGATPSSDILQ